jgi:hypothetical protein
MTINDSILIKAYQDFLIYDFEILYQNKADNFKIDKLDDTSGATALPQVAFLHQREFPGFLIDVMDSKTAGLKIQQLTRLHINHLNLQATKYSSSETDL